MTEVRGATVQEFKDTIEIMRKAYPFKDGETKIMSVTDLCSLQHNSIELITKDKATGTTVTLTRDIDCKELF